jgi:hypothetical protein
MDQRNMLAPIVGPGICCGGFRTTSQIGGISKVSGATSSGMHTLFTEAYGQRLGRGIVVAMQKKSLLEKENADAK